MSNQSNEQNPPDPQPEPLKFDAPTFDYIEKSGDQGDIEHRGPND